MTNKMEIGFTRFTYSIYQIERLARIHLENNQKMSATLVCVDHYLWDLSKYYVSVVELLERIDVAILKFKEQFPDQDIDSWKIAKSLFPQGLIEQTSLIRPTACSPRG